jgi:hypothetical protein
MKDGIKYKLGRIEGELTKDDSHKFIVVKNEINLVYHSISSKWQRRTHNDIAELLGVEDNDVLGGGHVQLARDYKQSLVLRIYGASPAYGSVPNQIMQRFPQDQLLGAYRQFELKIKKIIIDMFGTVKQHWGEYGLEEEKNGQKGNGRTQASLN